MTKSLIGANVELSGKRVCVLSNGHVEAIGIAFNDNPADKLIYIRGRGEDSVQRGTVERQHTEASVQTYRYIAGYGGKHADKWEQRTEEVYLITDASRICLDHVAPNREAPKSKQAVAKMMARQEQPDLITFLSQQSADCVPT